MSLKSEGGTQQAQDPLVAIEEEIKEVKDDIKELKAQIKAFDDDGKTPKDEFSKQSYLKWQDRLIEDKKRLNGLEADLRVLRDRQASSATSTAQQGK